MVPHTAGELSQAIIPGRLVTDRLHVLDVRSQIDQRLAIRAAFASQFQHPRSQTIVP
jgi:hypothetical protein